MKLNKGKKYIVLILAALLMFAPAITAYGQGNAVQEIQDNELVISSLGDNGNISDVKVLSHLRISGEGTVSIQDKSRYSLSSIRNLYSREKIEQKDASLDINANISESTGYKDIYYLSTLDKNEIPGLKMPISLQMTYYLDEQEIQAQKLAGKSGHLKIVCDLENLSGSKKTLEYKGEQGEMIKTEVLIYTPYIVSLSGWEFDNKSFSNVKAPGIAGKSPEGVVVDLKGKTTVSWSVPLIPPAYPARQYIVLEADAQNIQLPAFNIAVVPIIPTTAAVNNLGSVQESLGKLYNAFNSIQGGVGSAQQDDTLLWGLGSLKSGLGQMSGGIGSLTDKMKAVRFGLENPAFTLQSYDSAKGTDAEGDKPGVKNAVEICKTGIDTKLLPAFAAQKMVLGVMENTIGKAGANPVKPETTTSVYNDVNYLRELLTGTAAEKVITDAVNPKLLAMSANIAVFRDGGTMITSTGAVEFPASINAVETGAKAMSDGLGKANNGLGMIVMGLGNVDANGNPVKVLVKGKPGSILYALSYFESTINGQVLPGINKLEVGTSKIRDGSGQAKKGITAGLNTMASAPAIVSALGENAAKVDTFLGKPEGALGTVTYVYQTPVVSTTANTLNYGLGLIALALIILFAVGRPPKQAIKFTAEGDSKEV